MTRPKTINGLVVCVLVLSLLLPGCVGARKSHQVNLQRLDPSMSEPVALAASANTQLRIGSAALISPVETLKSYSALYGYMAREVGRSVEVVQRHTYAETNELVQSGGVEVALVCSYAYVLGQRDFGMEAIAVPVVKGHPEYYSYIIVRSDSGIATFDDLRGRTFAFTDPISTTGRLYPEGLLLDRGLTPDRFFRQTTFTYSHDNSIKAVDEGLVDGAAVDSLVYELTVKQDPQLGRRLVVIGRSEAYGAPPIVVNPKLQPELKQKLKQTLLTLHETPEGRRILAELDIERFVAPDDRWYDPVRRLAEKVRGK